MAKSGRVLSLILALLTVAALFTFASCGETEKPAVQTTAVASETKAPESGAEETTAALFEKTDYKGAKFILWQRDYNASSYASLYVENFTDDISDLMSQAVFKRNSMLEDFYNIDLEVRNGFTVDKYSIQLQGGEIDFDLILSTKSSLTPRIITGELQPFDNLDVDFSREWWHEKSLEDFEVAGNHYLVSNDVTIYRFSAARFFYWNKRIQQDHNLESPYDLMKADKWDIEHFLQMVQGVSTDNGFTALGEYGLLLETGGGNGVFAHLATGCGIRLTETRDDEITIILGEQMEKIDTLFSKLKSTFNNMYCVLDFSMAQALDTQGEGAGSSNMYNWGRKLFAGGHFLFTQTNIACSNQFIEMKDEYGVAPNPKYNSDQEDYIHKDDCNSLIFAIPNDGNIDLTRLGRILDYWAYASSQTVIPDYYEITIKTKRAYESEAGRVIDIVKATTVSEIGEAMSIGLSGVLNDAYGRGSIASAWASKKEAMETAIAAYNEWEPY